MIQKQLQPVGQSVDDSSVMREILFLVAAALAMIASAAASDDDNKTPANNDTPNGKTISLEASPPATRFYGSVDYLYWWVKPAPLPVPLVSSGRILSTHP